MNFNKKLNFYIYLFKNGIFFIDIHFNFKAHTPYKMVVILNAIPLNNNVIILEDVTSITLHSSYNPSPKIHAIASTPKKFLK